MSKEIKHTWDKITGSGLLKHKICEKCKCQKWYDMGFGCLIYTDRFGKTHYRAPDCILPNTKIR